MCTANWSTYGEDLKLKGIQWLKEFAKYDDDLMETAIRSCFVSCDKFPQIKDILEAIRDLAWEEQTKPKQIAYNVKRSESLQQKIYNMATGKVSTKEYLQNLDISKEVAYAKTIFPDISHELVLRNLCEIMQGMEQVDKCIACRTMKQACEGYRVVHRLEKTGWIYNDMAKCEKVDRR